MPFPLLGVLVALGTSGFLLSEEITIDKIDEAKKLGAELAANVYEPRLKELQSDFSYYSRVIKFNLTQVAEVIKDLRADIDEIVEEYDEHIEIIQDMGINTAELNLKPVGKILANSEDLEEISSLCNAIGYEKYKAKAFLTGSNGVLLSGVIGRAPFGVTSLSAGMVFFLAPVIAALNADTSKYANESYEKRAEVWVERINKEIEKINGLKVAGDRLTKEAFAELDKYLRQMQLLSCCKTNLKIKIAWMEIIEKSKR